MTRNLREYARQTSVRLVAGALLLIFLVGLGLIYWRYGLAPALMGLICLLGALVPIGLVWLSMAILDWIVKRNNED